MGFDANIIVPALGIFGLLIVVIIYQWIKKQPGGSGQVEKIGEQIHLGAITFMKTEYKMLSGFALVLLILMYIFLGFESALCFVVGAAASASAGYIGMNTATIANVRTTQAAHDQGSAAALKVAFFWGFSYGLISCCIGIAWSWNIVLFLLGAPFTCTPWLCHGSLGCGLIFTCWRRDFY